MLVELRRPARRGGRELPGGEDEAGPRPQDAGDLRSNPSLVWKEPERIDAHGPIETGRGQACGRGVTDQEAGSLPEPELQRPAPGLLNPHLGEVDPDQRGTRLPGDPQAWAAAAAGQVDHDLSRPDRQLCRHPAQIGQGHEAERVGLFR